MNEHIARKSHAAELFAQRESHLGGLPAHVLLDLARNEAASREWRKAAVELLLDKGFAQANHPELTAVVMEIKAERAARVEVEAVVESAVEKDMSGGEHIDFSALASVDFGFASSPPPAGGASSPPTPSITCGVTTKNLMQNEVFPVPPSAADCFVDPYQTEVIAVEPELPPAE